MNTKKLKPIITEIETLKPRDRSADFTAGVAAAQAAITTVLQEAADLERMQKLEAELAELRAKYPSTEQTEPKKRGRKPKDSNKPTQASLMEEKPAQPA